jgi:hypothetical protein
MTQQVRQRAVTGASPRGWSRPIENGLHFSDTQVRDQTRLSFLEGDRQDPADSFQRRWLAIFQEVQKGFDGGQRGAVETKLRDRSRSVKFRLLEIARIARAKGQINQDKLKQRYRLLDPGPMARKTS